MNLIKRIKYLFLKKKIERNYKIRSLIRLFFSNRERYFGDVFDYGIYKILIKEDKFSIKITIHTTRPGLIIGKEGKTLDELKAYLVRQIDKAIKITLIEHSPWKRDEV